MGRGSAAHVCVSVQEASRMTERQDEGARVENKIRVWELQEKILAWCRMQYVQVAEGRIH